MAIQQHKKAGHSLNVASFVGFNHIESMPKIVTSGMKPFVTIANSPDTGGLQQRSKVNSPTHIQRVGPSPTSGACHEKQSHR
jgi:hypothetical protein